MQFDRFFGLGQEDDSHFFALATGSREDVGLEPLEDSEDSRSHQGARYPRLGSFKSGKGKKKRKEEKVATQDDWLI